MATQPTVVHLNGLAYVVKGQIRHYDVDTQTPAFRTTGQFLRQNNPKIESYAFNDWSGGFGAKAVRPGHPEDLRKFFDATVLTIWRSALTLPITPNTDISSPIPGARISASAAFKGFLYALFSPLDDDGDTDSARSCNVDATGTGWGHHYSVVTEGTASDKVAAFDLVNAGDRLVAVAGLINDHLIRYSTDGSTWTAPATTAPPLNKFSSAAAMVADFHGARLAFDGTNIVLALHDSVNDDIEIQVSTDGGDTWGNPAGGAITVASGGGPTGLVPYLDIDDTTIMYLGAAEGVWAVDLAAGTASMVLPLPTADDNCRRMVVHNGSLYIPVDHGNSAPMGMKKMTVRGGDRFIEDVGLDIEQAIPSDMLGGVKWMKSAGPWLFCGISNATAGRIIALTGIPGEGWQNVRKNSNIFSWIDAFGLFLYWQENGLISTSAGIISTMENLLAPPNSGVTFDYSTPADLELPAFGADSPEDDTAFLQVQMDADDLVDSAEVVDFEYGVNGANPTTAGPTLDDTNRKQNLGSGVGVSGRTMRPNWEFNRGGTTGNTPKVRELVLAYRKSPSHLHGWEFVIDVDATVRNDPNRSYQSVRDDIETVNHSVPLVTFREAGQESEANVEMVPVVRFDRVSAAPMQEKHSEVRGEIRVRVEEVI